MRAVLECFEKKWHRQDFVAVAEKYGGVSNVEIKRDEAQSAVVKKLEAADGIALDLDPVTERRHLTRPAARGCPGLDIVGFVIRRTYTTVRRAIFRRARRQYLRAGREVNKSGTVPLFRAYKLASYYGYFTQTNSRKCSTTLRTEKIKPLACQVIGWATRQKERIHNEKCKHYAGPPAACRCL